MLEEAGFEPSVPPGRDMLERSNRQSRRVGSSSGRTGGSNPSRSKTLDPRSRDASSQNSSATEKTRLRRPRPCGLVQLLSSSPHRKPEMRKMCLLGDLRVQISLEQITRCRIFAMTRHGAASRSLLPCRILGGNQIRFGAGEVKMCRSQGV